MKDKLHVLFCSIVFTEMAVLIIESALCIYYLYWAEILDNIDRITIMVRIAVFIGVLLMPFQAILYNAYLRKREKTEDMSSGGTVYMAEREQLHRVFHFCGGIFIVLWLVHCVVFTLIVEGSMGIEHGSDMYMFLVKPGFIISMSSGFGLMIADNILYGIPNMGRYH